MKRPRNARSDIARLARYTRWAITIIGGLLAAVFTWLQVRDIPFAMVVENTKAEFIQRFTIILYYLCWIAGSRFDVAIQQAAYVDDPQHGHYGLTTITLLAIFCGVAVALLWATGDEQRFAIMLTLFMTANIGGWQYIIYRVKPAMNTSRRQYREQDDYFGAEQLQTVVDYMAGPWQWWRFGVILGIIIISDFVIFVPSLRQLVSEAIHYAKPQLSTGAVSSLLPEALLLVFVLTSETWIWIMRVRVAASVGVIELLSKKYELKPRRARSLKPQSGQSLNVPASPTNES